METVERIMSRNLLTAAPEERLRDAAKRMVGRRVGAILVLEGERLAGILTERDVLRAVGNGLDPDALVGIVSVRDVLRVGVQDASPRGV